MEQLTSLLPPNVMILLILSGCLTTIVFVGGVVFLIFKLGGKFLEATTKIPVAIESVKNAVEDGFSRISLRLDNLEHRMSTIEGKMPNFEKGDSHEEAEITRTPKRLGPHNVASRR
ncbi:MAG: hypothetical protein HEQ32_01935 [Vampirovibrio sp.]